MEEAALEIERPQHDDLRTQYLASIIHRSTRTVATYRDNLKKLQENIDVPLACAPIDEIMLLFTRLSKRYKHSTLNLMRATLRNYLRFCGRGEDAELIKYSNQRWMPRSDLSQEQLDAVLVRARPNERALILTFYSTGARLGELCGKQWERERPKVADVDWPMGRIHIVGKGGHPDCLIFIPRREQALGALREYVGSKHSGPIFPCRWRSYRLMKRAGNRAEVRLHPHALRHAGATSLIKQGVSTRMVQAWLRHASLEMTERYTHIAKNDLIELAQKREWR